MSFRLVPKSVSLNDLEWRNGVISAKSGSFRAHVHKSSRSLCHLMSSCQTSYLLCEGISCNSPDRVKASRPKHAKVNVSNYIYSMLP